VSGRRHPARPVGRGDLDGAGARIERPRVGAVVEGDRAVVVDGPVNEVGAVGAGACLQDGQQIGADQADVGKSR
jgi:hypothetical protein